MGVTEDLYHQGVKDGYRFVGGQPLVDYLQRCEMLRTEPQMTVVGELCAKHCGVTIMRYVDESDEEAW